MFALVDCNNFYASCERFFKPGYLYLKLEVYSTGLIPEREVQLNLFSAYDAKRKNQVSELMDRLNGHYGKGTLILAAEGFNKECGGTF